MSTLAHGKPLSIRQPATPSTDRWISLSLSLSLFLSLSFTLLLSLFSSLCLVPSPFHRFAHATFRTRIYLCREIEFRDKLSFASSTFPPPLPLTPPIRLPFSDFLRSLIIMLDVQVPRTRRWMATLRLKAFASRRDVSRVEGWRGIQGEDVRVCKIEDGTLGHVSRDRLFVVRRKGDEDDW